MANYGAASSSGTITPDFGTPAKSPGPSSRTSSSSPSHSSSTTTALAREDVSFDDAEPPSSVLPPADTGIGAYLFLLGLWLNFFAMGGVMLNFGIFQAYYARHMFPAPPSSRHIATVGTLAFGTSNFLNPVFTQLALRHPHRRRTMAFAGYLGAITALLAASFATELWQLMVTQGVAFGVSWVCVAAPLLTMLNEWFERKRGRAYGVVFGGGGTGVVVLPLFLETLLQRFEFRWTLRMYVAVMAVICGVGLLLARERRPVRPTTIRSGSSPRWRRRRRDKEAGQPWQPQRRPPYAVTWAFLRHPLFCVFAAAVLLHALAFQLPLIFLPSFGQALGYSRERSALVLTAYGAAQVLGQFAVGSVSDRVNVHLLTGLCPLVSGAAALALWGPAKRIGPLAAYAAVQGLAGPGFNILYSRMASAITDDAGLAAMIFSMFAFQRGVGNMLSGPAASALLRDEVAAGEYGLGRFGGVIVLVGLAMLGCSVNGAGWFWREWAERHRIPVQGRGQEAEQGPEQEQEQGEDEEEEGLLAGDEQSSRDYGSNRR